MALSRRVQRRAVLLLAAGCLACASAPHEGEAVHIAEESAIIIWDAAAQTQHFIRAASFETKAKDFGFLVPTPSVPKLAEADDAAFLHLDQLTTLRLPALAAAAPKSAPAKSGVVVIERVIVAGYDAAVLAATDAGALDGWLKTHGYASTPELRAWARHYVERRWIITAFKIATHVTARRLEAGAVRMSFSTARPFFPYREPAATGAAAPRSRALRIYFLGDFRPEGRIGADGAWPGRAIWSGTISVAERDRLLELLKLAKTLPDSTRRLTRFTDASTPRPGRDDLFFSAAADQSAVPGPKSTELEEQMLAAGKKTQRNQWIVLATILLAAIGAYFYYSRRGRRK